MSRAQITTSQIGVKIPRVHVFYNGYDDYGGASAIVETTLESMPLGRPQSNRIIVAGIAHRTSTVTAVTIGGASATQLVTQAATSVFFVDIWVAEVATGTSADVVIDFSITSSGGVCCGLWSVYGASTTPTDTDGVNNTVTPSLTLDVAQNGAAIAMMVSNPGPGSTVWASPMIESFEGGLNTSQSDTGSGAMATGLESGTVPCSISETGALSEYVAMAAITLEPEV